MNGTSSINWSAYLERHYVAATARLYARDAARYRDWLGGEAAALTADYARVVAYVDHLRAQQYRPATLSRTLSAVKAYHRYLLETGRRNDHPAAGLTLRDTGRRRGGRSDLQLQELLDADELQCLLDAPLEVYERVARRGRLIVGLLVHQALRAGEVERLEVGDVDLEGAGLRIAATPRTRGRTLGLHASQVMQLHTYLREERPRLRRRSSEPTERLLLTFRGGAEQRQGVAKVVRKLRPLVKGKRLTAPLIRQSVIADKLRRGEGLRQVQTFAGHNWVSTTEGYRESGLGELRRAVERYHPLDQSKN